MRPNADNKPDSQQLFISRIWRQFAVRLYNFQAFANISWNFRKIYNPNRVCDEVLLYFIAGYIVTLCDVA